jgi:hypothetical protein
MDWINFRTGEKNPNGTPQRVTTMFYNRMLAEFYKHVEHEGVVKGLTKEVMNKGSGLLSLMQEMYTGEDVFGHQFRNPYGTEWEKLQQNLAYALSRIEPISIQALQQNVWEAPVKTGVLSIFGMGPEPKYMSETATAARIRDAFHDFVEPRATPFDKAVLSKEHTELREAYQHHSPKYPEMLHEFVKKNKLDGQDIRRLMSTLGSREPAEVRMFSMIRSPAVQQNILDHMTPEERRIYLPHANRKLRWTYRPPERRAQREAAGAR